MDIKTILDKYKFKDLNKKVQNKKIMKKILI